MDRKKGRPFSVALSSHIINKINAIVETNKFSNRSDFFRQIIDPVLEDFNILFSKTQLIDPDTPHSKKTIGFFLTNEQYVKIDELILKYHLFVDRAEFIRFCYIMLLLEWSNKERQIPTEFVNRYQRPIVETDTNFVRVGETLYERKKINQRSTRWIPVEEKKKDDHDLL